MVEEVNRAKPRIIINDEWSKFDEECVLKFRTGPKGKELCNWFL